jgi:hypothetical protein
MRIDDGPGLGAPGDAPSVKTTPPIVSHRTARELGTGSSGVARTIFLVISGLGYPS